MTEQTDARLNAFTVDVEDYFHVSAFADRIAPEDWDHYECRVEASTHRVLDIAARHGVTGTFFILGWVADRYPDLVVDIHSAGHEIGCHSYWHQLIYDLGRERFREDLTRGRDLLQDIIGEPVRLYRAPSFSVTAESRWALEILVEEGFRIDSSIYPVRHDRYGIPDAPVAPHRISTDSGPLVEFPGSVWQRAGANVPMGGGGYFRLFPWWVMRRLIATVSSHRPLNFYIHPWELDPDQPRLPGSLKSRFRHYQNLGSTTRKLDDLLTEFRFGTVTQVLESCGLTDPAELAPVPQTGATT